MTGCAGEPRKPARHPEKAKAPAGTDRQGPAFSKVIGPKTTPQSLPHPPPASNQSIARRRDRSPHKFFEQRRRAFVEIAGPPSLTLRRDCLRAGMACQAEALKERRRVAEGVRFELTIPLRVCRFSRPVP